MRILWFNHRDLKHPLAGGAERTIYEVSKRLVSKGYEVNLVSVNPGGLVESEMLDGIKIVRIKGNVRAHLAVPKIIWRIKPDFIIDDLAHVVPWLSPLFTNKKVIVFFRHLHSRSLPGQVNFLFYLLLKNIEKSYRFFYRNNIFVTETETGINDLVNLGIKRNMIRRILPGVDRDMFKPCEKTKIPSIIYFGGMRDYKRPWLAVELMNQLREGNIKMKILGSGHSLETVTSLCKRYGLEDTIDFMGRLSNTELAKTLCESWINVHFSVTEGFGYTIIESASCGVPTLALEAPGVSEVVRGFKMGITETDIEHMALDIREIQKNYDEWSLQALDSSNVFSWENTVSHWIKLIEGE
jgi:glycosyltransferase involved in cell wall biosynthesis